MTESTFTQYAPGRRYTNRPMSLCAGEVAEIQRTPLEAISWWSVLLLAVALFSIAAVGAVGFLVLAQ